MPMICKQSFPTYREVAWEWNDDFTQLTFFLRKGHKWSDGAPFHQRRRKVLVRQPRARPKIIEKPQSYALVADKPMTVETPDETTVVFKLPAPKPGLLAHFATSYAQAFQPKHFLGQYHPDINPDADALAQECGFENGIAAVSAYYGNSDWTDTPSPMLSNPDKVDCLPKATQPTLESRISTSPTRPKDASWWPTPISTWWTRRVSSFPTSAARMSFMRTTTKFGSSSW